MLYLLNLLELFIPNLREWLEIIGILILICGIAEAFLGYKLFKMVLGIVGFLLGAFFGVLLFLNSGNIYSNSDSIRIYILIGGIIGSILAETFYKLGVFLTVGAMGALTIFLLTQSRPISLVLGVICGIAGVIIDKYVIIVTTALSGGRLAALGIWFIGLSNGENKSGQFLGWVIGILGILFQLWLEKVKPTDQEAAEGIGDWLLGLAFLVFYAVHFLGKHLYGLIKNPKETLHNLTLKKDSQGGNLFIMLLLGLSVVIGIILGALFQSMMFGFGVVTVLYVLLILLYIRKRRAETLQGGYTPTYEWEKYINIIMDNHVFMMFIAPMFPGFFICALIVTFIDNDFLVMILIILEFVGMYFGLFKALVYKRPERPEVKSSEAGNSKAESGAENVKMALQSGKQSKNNFCSMCGSQLPEGASFCQMCGAKVHRG